MKTQEQKIIDRDQAIIDAREILNHPYVVLDTETTGLNNAQMCQIALLQSNGLQYKSLVKPTIPIEAGAAAVHGITDDDVKYAPQAIDVVKLIPGGIALVIYNAPFDLKVLDNSIKALGIYGTNFGDVLVYDAMRIYSHFIGEWHDYYGNYKWHKLEIACERSGIEIDLKLHDAMSDCIMTERLVKYIAAQKLSTE